MTCARRTHRFIGATVGAGKSPTFHKVANAYVWMRHFHGLPDNLVPLKGSKEQLEQTLIDHEGNCIFFTNESMIEDDMSRSSAVDSKNTAHTVVSHRISLFLSVHATFIMSSITDNCC